MGQQQGQQGQQRETRDFTGVLFRNDRRTTDNHPHAKGRALIGGRWFWVSAWTKENHDGKYQSLAFDEMTDEQAAKYGGHRTAGGGGGNGSRNAAPPARRQQQDRGPFGNDRNGADIPF